MSSFRLFPVVPPRAHERRGQRSRVYVLSEVYYPETTSTGYYLTTIAERLARNFTVEVVCARPSNGGGYPNIESRHGVRIVRVGRMNVSSAAVVWRTVGALSRAVRMFLLLLRGLRRGDTVLVVTNPPFLPPLTALVCLLRRARFVLLVHDLYPDAAVVAGVLRRDSVAECNWRRLQRWVYRRANRIICLGRDMKDLVAKTEPQAIAKLFLITNWAETDSVRVLDKGNSRFAVNQGVAHRFVVLYVGNLGRTHDPALIAEAARGLERQPEVMLLIAATGSRFADFAADVQREARPNLRTVSLPGSREQQSDTLAAGDVVLITFKVGMRGVSVPSRMYNAMAAGKPLIAVTDAESELALVVREEGIGWVVRPGDAAGLAQAILEAYANPFILREMGVRARAAAVTKYSPELVLMRYQLLFESLENESLAAC